MKTKYCIVIAVMCFVQCVFAQSEQVKTMKDMYDNKRYSEVINYKPKNKEALAAKSLYYVGMAYYMENDDENAMTYLDSALNMGPVDYDMYYYKGMLFFYAKKYDEALPMFDKAISLSSDEADFYGSKGDAYISLNNMDSALVYYKKATSLSGCKSRYYLLVGEVLSGLKKDQEALSAFKLALEKISPADNQDEYKECFYNIGLMQQITGDSIGGKATFEKYVSQYPDDYHAVAKLIQAYYSMHDYEKAKTTKKTLYSAHKAASLPDDMKEKFCFDQFHWNGKRIMAFENYDEPDVYSYVKHLFYVVSDSGEVEYRIQSESDAMLHKEHPDKLYVLCLVKDGSYSTYWNFTFNDDVSYTDLKNAVLAILNNISKPAASTQIGK
jgi:tetratricopeptide (TPR) repeat protein